MQVTILNMRTSAVHVHRAGCRDIERELPQTQDHDTSYTFDASSMTEVAEDYWSDIIAEGGMTEAEALEQVTFFPCCKDLPETVAQTAETGYTGSVSDQPSEGENEMPTTPTTRGRKSATTPDAQTARDNSVLDGVRAEDVKDAPAKPAPRTRKPAAKKPENKVQSVKRSAAKSPAPAKTEPTPAPATKIDKRAAKQDLARRVVNAAADLFNGQLAGDEAFLQGLTKEEAEAAVAQWLHHLPTGQDGTNRWWAESLPRPDRSDWR